MNELSLHTVDDKNINLEADQLGEKFGYAIELRIRPSIFNEYVLPLNVATFP